MKPTFLHSGRCCLFIIDPQERLMAHIHAADRVTRTIALMAHLGRTLDFPVLASTQYKKGIGPIVPEIADLLEGVACPDKMTFNGLADGDIRRQIENLPQEIDTLLLCGVETHICVYQTAIGALQAGYSVWIVADGVSSRLPDNDRLGQERLRELGAVLAPAEMIVYELLQRAGTEQFKTMLPYLK